jgi:hypothetical protein
MTVAPDYDGHYDVDLGETVIDATYTAGAWEGDRNAFLRWRGRQTKMRKSEAERLKVALSRHRDSPEHSRDTALAAVQLARAAQERAARKGKRAAIRTACRYFQIAVGLGARLDHRDASFLQDWWAHPNLKSKKRVEREVQGFLAGKRMRYAS